MKIYRDPENIGWAGCVYIKPEDKTILLVENLKRETQAHNELLKQGFETEEDQKRHWRRITWELSQKGVLQKPGKWELLAGGIAYWQGNAALREEFKKLSEEARKEFEKQIGIRVLFNNELLEPAADHTAESEFVEECGLIVGKKILLARAKDPDRNDPKNPDLFYPRFWYLITEIAGGELRKEPVKATISAPQWIPLLQLHPYLAKENSFPFHPSHCLGVVAAAKYFIKQGRTEFSEVVSYLEKTFGSQKEIATFEDGSDWESFAKTVQPLER